MNANPRTLDDLFNPQLRYVVPMFQRLYVWSESPQWTTLWEDVVEKADLQLDGQHRNAHYLGALIIEGVRPSSPREVKRFLVIDGQQRLTTLQLLLCAFRDVARTRDWKALDRTLTRYLENADPDVMERPEEEVLKLWPTTMNRDLFRKIVTAGSRAAVEKAFPLQWVGRRRKPEPRNPLVGAYLYFSRVIDEWIKGAADRTGKNAEACAFTLLQSLRQDFCVVEIALAEGDDSQEIFYSLNSQGRPLSQSDLLRSLIFMRAEREQLDRDRIFADFWERFESEFWSTEIRRGGRSYSRLDLGLRFFLMAKSGALVDARRVNEEYRRWTTVQPPRYSSVRDELADFTRHADRFRHYESAAGTHLPSTDMRRIMHDLDVSTVLPLLLFLEVGADLPAEELSRCLNVLESFLVRRAFTGEETKEHNKLFVEIVGGIRENAPTEMADALTTRLLSGGGSTRGWPTDEKVMERAISRPIGQELRTPALRLILERLELGSRTKKSEVTDLPAGLQIEHVMPQSWAGCWPLNGITIPQTIAQYPYMAKDELAAQAEAIRRRNGRIQSLGNLTLLNASLNPSVGNASFDVKVKEYRHSILRLNRYFEQLEAWNEDAIEARSRTLGELICRVWPRPQPASV